MERMTKTELLKLLSELKLPKEEYWLLSTSALVFRGIYPDAADLDIAVTDNGLELLKLNYDLKPKNDGFYIVTDNIECVCDGSKEGLVYQPEYIDGYYVQNIDEYLEYLKKSSREKDKIRIPLVEKYIREIRMCNNEISNSRW